MNFTRDSLVTLAAQAGYYVLSFVFGVVVARLFGPLGKGQLFLGLLFSSVFLNLVSFSLEIATVYLLNHKRYTPRELATTLLAIGLSVGTGVAALFWALLPFLQPILEQHGIKAEDLRIVRIAVLSVPFELTTLYLGGLLWGTNRIAQYNVLKPIQITLAVLALGGLYLANALTPMSAITLIVCSQVATSITTVILIARAIGFSASINPDVARALYRFGRKAQLGEVADFIINKLDSFLIGFFVGTSTLGLYSVALTGEVLWFIPISLHTALLPRVSANTHEKSAKESVLVAHANVFALLVLGLLIFLLAPWLIPLAYGPSFTPAVLPFRILLGAIVILGLTKPLKAFLSGIGRPEVATFASIVTLIINVLLMPFAVQRFGIVGAAEAIFVSYLFYSTVISAGFIWYANLPATNYLALRDSYNVFAQRFQKK